MPKLLVDGKHPGECPEIVEIPASVAVCPECGGRLFGQADEWEPGTGALIDGRLTLDCEYEPDLDDPFDPISRSDAHKFFQSDWQPVIDKVAEWAKQHVRVDVSEAEQ